MNIFAVGIPNLRITTVGTKRNSFQVIEATTGLEAWDGYLKNYKKKKKLPDGTVTLDFGGYHAAQTIDWQPQINAYHHLMQNQCEIRNSILKSLTGKIDELTQYLDPNDLFVPNVMPETDFDFKPFVGPASISFHEEESKDGVSYLEWHFLCSWDDEHGFWVTTHKERVIHIDQDTDPWKIYEDNGTLVERQEEQDERAKNFEATNRQKPWWQFW